MSQRQKRRAPIQTLWTSPANPNLDLGWRLRKHPPQNTAADEAREAELKERLKPFEAVLEAKTLWQPTG